MRENTDTTKTGTNRADSRFNSSAADSWDPRLTCAEESSPESFQNLHRQGEFRNKVEALSSVEEFCYACVDSGARFASLT